MPAAPPPPAPGVVSLKEHKEALHPAWILPLTLGSVLLHIRTTIQTQETKARTQVKMGFIFSKSMNENMKNQQEFMLMNARLQIEVCGSSWWGRKAGQQRERRQISEPLAEVVPSSIINDPEIVSLMLQSIQGMPQELRIAARSGKEKLLRELHFALEDSNLNLEEMKKTFLNTQYEAEDKSLSKLDKHPRKKRDNYIKMSDKCCNVGCTRRELATRC
ncbi:prorelaxin isoform X3 [Vulpes lagopus]|uniref:prorelaxin isoform X3 n=1 Tax=Vulpes lagopus TaxID=494514 RepID=UPI001BC93E7B|nr:prorelaxin isoform X3 [Vulpes lagopus]